MASLNIETIYSIFCHFLNHTDGRLQCAALPREAASRPQHGPEAGALVRATVQQVVRRHHHRGEQAAHAAHHASRRTSLLSSSTRTTGLRGATSWRPLMTTALTSCGWCLSSSPSSLTRTAMIKTRLACWWLEVQFGWCSGHTKGRSRSAGREQLGGAAAGLAWMHGDGTVRCDAQLTLLSIMCSSSFVKFTILQLNLQFYSFVKAFSGFTVKSHTLPTI